MLRPARRAVNDARLGRVPLALGPLVALALHLAAATRYGFFRDELYFIACGDRLAWGYVDQPPLVALFARGAFALSGGSLALFRLPAFVLHASCAGLAGLLARRLGGGRFAVALAGLCVATSPLSLGLGHLVTMNAVEPLLWLAAAGSIAALLDSGDERLWLLAGALAGLGTLNKHSMVFFAGCLLAGVLVAAPRTLRSRFLAAGIGLAVLLVLPHAIWQIRNGFPMLELLRNGQQGKNLPFALGAFLLAQVMDNGPLHAAVWLAGLAWLLRGRFRALGVAYLLLLGLYIALHAKPYYLAPIYPLLFAAGGVAIEGLLQSLTARIAAATLVGASGVLLAPLAIPLLPEAALVSYLRATHQEVPRLENKRYGALPQHYADQHGWEALEAAVASVVRALPQGEAGRAAIYAQNYGEAAAVEILGRRDALPPVASGHNSYFTWGPPPGRDVWIVLGGDAVDHRKAFGDVQQAARVPHDPWVMPYEDTLPIYVCRKPLRPIEALWPGTRHYE